MKLEELKTVIPYKWKVQSYNTDKTKGSCVAYIDARDVMDILDKVCGPSNWQDKYEFVGNKLIAGIGIYNPELKKWIWKFDTGTESQTEGEKGIFSDAFKRAAVKWGIGRFLYDLDIKWIPVKASGKLYRPVDNNGSFIYDLTEHFSKNSNSEEIQKAAVIEPYKKPVISQPKVGGECAKCGAPLKWSENKKKWYCSALCWNNPAPQKEIQKDIPDTSVPEDLPF